MPTLSKSFVWRLLAGLDGEVLTGRGRLTGLRFSFCPRLLWIFKGFSLFVGFSFCSKIRDMITLCAPEKLWRDIQEIFRRDVQLSGATLVDLPLCYLCLHLNLEQRRQTKQLGRKQDPRLVIPGQQQDPTPLYGCELFHYKRFSPHCKINLQHQR